MSDRCPLGYFVCNFVICIAVNTIYVSGFPIKGTLNTQDFHRKYVLVPADKAANNVVVV